MRTLVRRFGSPLAAVGTGLLMVLTLAPGNAVARDNVATPGNFTGYGFDQCLAPTQKAMNRWLKNSPFLAVGIYISGDSRGLPRASPTSPRPGSRPSSRRAGGCCRSPSARRRPAAPRFPRYDDDETIRPTRGPNGGYPTPGRQGSRGGGKPSWPPPALGIVPGSTLWYDLEGFDHTRRDCRESALAFLSAWTNRCTPSATSPASTPAPGPASRCSTTRRVNRPAALHAARPDLDRPLGRRGQHQHVVHPQRRWHPAGRMKQYQGGHNETWGGVTINIDRNFLDLGRGSVGPRPRATAAGSAQLRRTTRGSRPGTTQTAGSRPCSAC